MVQLEEVVLGDLLEEVNLKGHWIHRLNERGGGGRMGKKSDIEECHTYSTMKLYSANLYHFNHTI